MTRIQNVTRRGAAAAIAGIAAGSIVRPARAAEDALDRIRREKTIRVGIFNQAPWGFRNTDGLLTGHGPDVLRAALSRIGVTTFEPVITEFSALIPSLLANRLDAVSCGLYINPARCKQVLFGDPDIQMGVAFLVKAGNPHALHSYQDLAAKPAVMIGMLRGGSEIQYTDAAGIPRDRVVLFPENQAAVAGVRTGRIDVFIGTAASIGYLLKTANDPSIGRALPLTGWKDANGVEVKGYPAVAFRPTDATLRDAYNEQLRAIRANGDLMKVYQTYGFGESELPPDGVNAAKICGPAT
jgi:polar amino acid transport system substrate-binding protein